jgi:hypothetical protein
MAAGVQQLMGKESMRSLMFSRVNILVMHIRWSSVVWRQEGRIKSESISLKVGTPFAVNGSIRLHWVLN